MTAIGKISTDREAIIELEIIGTKTQKQKISAVIDTGFNGYLALPRSVVQPLKLQLVGNRRATLADGNIVALDVYLAKVLWHDQEREILVLQIGGGPLIGMSLLYGSRMILNVIIDGDVIIEPLDRNFF